MRVEFKKYIEGRVLYLSMKKPKWFFSKSLIKITLVKSNYENVDLNQTQYIYHGSRVLKNIGGKVVLLIHLSETHILTQPPSPPLLGKKKKWVLLDGFIVDETHLKEDFLGI